ncbi:MAG: Zn-dependent hydrolase of the beta-lactamase fold-like protein [Candidatus Wolfebacteria bacterium GW2011_GWA2_42_10]|uniref:Zn-dependent hydrolase of the beta-lactamase fold-like protein n=2 Tax=Candidatus Wolfeibacteriota TaxID=1752735 RepID=A0A0G0ZTH8_9BACT|nr:MAG: Zn-dependent hydrolase of the beta-lactamase fold-like protein [Candidatus Wolfebacteria bacterium GW2011_GWB1_41_12]KKS25286.1 MAG: Zn-dependent hydrolase of the beta-lactamase fold-like protein [Candidatus Wolfebacteria bacterium GW2011_GWA2_42_10]KKT56726.1 MAG: Zn-dependent hydrolase of the beta-lactamase fold-like protein [Candidatus Wolfebacteria bacterium GW2011_GWA1_44_24]
MTISFYGEGCFKVMSGETTVLTDPPHASSGLATPRFKFDVLLKTLTPLPINQPDDESVGQIIGPGEYNIKGINIAGFNLLKESSEKFFKTVFLLEVESLRLAFLGHISQIPELEIDEHFEEIDILFIPAGGKPFLEQKSAVKLIKQIEPKIVIPSFYKISGLKRPADDLKIFLEEINHQKIEPQEKLTIKKKDLAEIKKTKIVTLKP